MASSERDDAVEAVGRHGWFISRTTKRGYLVMHCACGRHKSSFHKTPSNPKHFRERARHMISECSTQRSSGGADQIEGSTEDDI